MKPATMILAAVALSLAAIGPSAIRAAEKPLNPKAITIKVPDQIPWVRNAAGTAEAAVLYGDPDKPGLYAVMQKWLPGNMSRPHWHPNDRFITVLKGTWWMGTGTTFDPASTTEIGSFSFFGVSVPVFCTALAPASGSDPAETRTFSGSLTVASEWT